MSSPTVYYTQFVQNRAASFVFSYPQGVSANHTADDCSLSQACASHKQVVKHAKVLEEVNMSLCEPREGNDGVRLV